MNDGFLPAVHPSSLLSKTQTTREKALSTLGRCFINLAFNRPTFFFFFPLTCIGLFNPGSLSPLHPRWFVQPS